MNRVILHSDMNSFYASVECLYEPAIRNLPVAVCGSRERRHGIILAKNQLAKRAGVQTAEPVVDALRKCPSLHLVEPHRQQYQRFSEKANKIYYSYTERVQPFGIDESWLDISDSVNSFEQGIEKANEIRERIYQTLGLTVSIGVSWNRVFAKLGSDTAQPNGICVISKQNYKTQIWPMPARALLFVGPATQKKLDILGINTIGDIANANPDVLRAMLGKWGETLYIYATGLEDSPVARWDDQEINKSIGNSTTTPRDLRTRDDIKQVIYTLSESVAQRMRNQQVVGKVVQVWLRDTNLCGQERQVKLSEATQVSDKIARAAMQLVDANWQPDSPLRSVGVRVGELCDKKEWQMGFFSDEEKLEKFEHCLDGIRNRFGHWSVRRAASLVDDNLHIDAAVDNDTPFLPFNKVVK